jgi:beta-glucanase (GH16 family)
MNNIKSIVFLAALALTTFLTSCQTSKVKLKESKVASNSVNGFEIDYSKPIWADEFDKDGKPNAEIWSYDLGGNGCGNAELQNYTNDIKKAEVKNGKLHIKAIKEKTGNNAYSSARLVTKNKKDILYGRVEVKAKLPVGIGTWPAIWMLGTDNSYGDAYWPDNGEIDIMEHVGYDQDVVHGNVHTKAFNHVIGTNKGN